MVKIQPAQIVIDARQHGVAVLSVDVNHSCWDSTLETQGLSSFNMRLGFRQVNGLRADDMQILVDARNETFANITQ